MTRRIQDGIPVGNFSDKYGTKNPIARRMVKGFTSALTELSGSLAVRTVHEVGCGEGYLVPLLALPGRELLGTDFSSDVIAFANTQRDALPPDVRFDVASVYDLTPAHHRADLVVCCEVLEHLEHPDDALRVLRTLADPYLLVSVPREPVWRMLNVARGKYVSRFGNTPGHLNHWSSTGFLRMLRRQVRVIEVRRPFPWTMALCRTD